MHLALIGGNRLALALARRDSARAVSGGVPLPGHHLLTCCNSIDTSSIELRDCPGRGHGNAVTLRTAFASLALHLFHRSKKKTGLERWIG